MSGPSGTAIDPTLLIVQQARAAAAAAAAASHPPEGSSAAVKQEDMQRDIDMSTAGPTHSSLDHAMDPQLSSSSASARTTTAAMPALNGGSPSSPSAAGPAGRTGKTDSLETAHLDLHDDAELAAFLAKMEEYEPLLPDSVTRFYLEKAGFQSSDDRVTRMLGLAAQKFVSDIAKDAYAFARTRTTAGPGRAPSGSGSTQTTSGKNKDRSKTVLTMEDLSAALHEYGVETSRAPYYR